MGHARLYLLPRNCSDQLAGFPVAPPIVNFLQKFISRKLRQMALWNFYSWCGPILGTFGCNSTKKFRGLLILSACIENVTAKTGGLTTGNVDNIFRLRVFLSLVGTSNHEEHVTASKLYAPFSRYGPQNFLNKFLRRQLWCPLSAKRLDPGPSKFFDACYSWRRLFWPVTIFGCDLYFSSYGFPKNCFSSKMQKSADFGAT
jgi:hypothetical protein